MLTPTGKLAGIKPAPPQYAGPPGRRDCFRGRGLTGCPRDRLGPVPALQGPARHQCAARAVQPLHRTERQRQDHARAGDPAPAHARPRTGPAAGQPRRTAPKHNESPEIVFHFNPPDDDIEVRLSCRSEMVCDLLQVRHPDTPDARRRWDALRARLGGIRAYLLDHYAMAEPVARTDGGELASNGRNLAAVLAALLAEQPAVFARLEAEFHRALPDFASIETRDVGQGNVELGLRLADGGELVTAENASQGALYALAILTLSFSPRPPPVLCLEEADRGVHPRLLREVRDAFYRLSYPDSFGEKRAPVQIVATTHSPFLLDLFRDHPEEIIIATSGAQRHLRAAERPAGHQGNPGGGLAGRHLVQRRARRRPGE